jgi:hypothetical protein
MESLTLTDLQCENATLTECSSDYISSTGFTCKELDLPTNMPTTFIAGTMYYNKATQSIRIYDGTRWY